MTSRLHIYEVTKNWMDQLHLDLAAASTVTSTNDLAKNEAFSSQVPSEKFYLADAQTNGRGRGANTWLTPPPGDALLMSWSFQLERPAQAITGPLLGLAVYRALTQAFTLPLLSIKPPNDIYWEQKKILGILAEAVQQGEHHRLIVGIGLNVFSSPQEIETASCLAKCLAENPGVACGVTNENWRQFLESLKTELRAAAKKSMALAMSGRDCRDLLAAVKLHPSGQRYTDILPNGDMSLSTGETLCWRDL